MAVTSTSAPAPKTNVVMKIWNRLSGIFWKLLGRVETSALLKRLESEPFVAPAHSKAWYLGRAVMVLAVLVLTHGLAYHIGHGTPRVMRIVSLASPYITIGKPDMVSSETYEMERKRAADCEATQAPPAAPAQAEVVFPPNSDPATFEAEHPRPAPSTELAPLKLQKKAAKDSPAVAMMADAPVVKKKAKPKCEGWCAVSNAFKVN